MVHAREMHVSACAPVGDTPMESSQWNSGHTFVVPFQGQMHFHFLRGFPVHLRPGIPVTPATMIQKPIPFPSKDIQAGIGSRSTDSILAMESCMRVTDSSN
jgi:hypothetical protein